MDTRSKAVEPEAYSGFVLTFEPERTEWLARHLSPRLKLTESFSAVDWNLGVRELVFISLEHDPYSIAAFCLMEKMYGSGGFRKSKMRMSKIHVFAKSVSAHELGQDKFVDLVCTPERMRRIPPRKWNSLLDGVRKCRPADAQEIDEIIALREVERRILGESNLVERLNEQRDALGLALDIADVDRSPVLRSIETAKIKNAKSILDLLENLPVHERSMVEHDAKVFEMLLGEAPTRVATIAGNSGRSVRVLVADKTDLETALGIDLIIYNTCYENFLLLQYKRMEKMNRDWLYGVPESSDIYGQLGRMQAFMRKVDESQAPASPTMWSYRLNDDPFYFKFCEQFRPDARDTSLVPGITLPASHLHEFLGLPEALGKYGGVSVGYHNCPRYLTNTDFIQLARSGWIGAGQRSVALMKEVLEANEKGGRKAMLAVIDVPKDQSASGRDWRDRE